MSIISAKELAKYYGAQDVFANVSFDIAHGDKIALVGPNGVGKTTLLRIIVGLEEPSGGTLHRARGLRMAYLPQQPEFPSQQTLYGEMLNVFAGLREQQRALLVLAEEMSRVREPGALMNRYAQAEQRFELAGGYTYETRIKRVLSGLGFEADTYDWPISVLSGGQVTRALLARLLLQEPELLVLDEPTNYLDLSALEWLEAYLRSWRYSLLVVSHDRRFLDKVASRVWEFSHDTLHLYRGNYGKYVIQRQERLERLRREYEAQQEHIAKTEEFVRRYKAGQRSREARGREKRLKRLERIEAPKQDRQMSLHLSTSLRSGDNVLMCEGARVGYASKPQGMCVGTDKDAEEHALFDMGQVLIRRGERVALIGPNGVGKTTLLRTILGQVEPLFGQIRIGASVQIGYLSQVQDWLDESKTVLDQVLEDSELKVDEARHLLGRFLFSGDEVFKRVGALSGGELSRLALASLTIKGANFLLLDEPTSHLDVASQEILQSVLLGFNGTLLFVSHDRYLIDALATHIWELQDGRLRTFEGNYSAYIQERESQPEIDVVSETSGPVRQRETRRQRERDIQRVARKRAKRLSAVEEEIERIERRLASMPSLIELASAAQDVERVESLGVAYQHLQTVLEEQLREWEGLVGQNDAEG